MKNSLILILIIAAGCSANKEAQLEALKSKRDKLNKQIEQLETQLSATKDTASRNEASTFVSVENIELKKFDHFIEVQGKLDGDENIALYPETAGNVVEVNVRVGQYVKEGDVLARLNDATFQEQLKSLETNYALADETFTKQENLWKQQIGSEIQYLQAKANKESLEAQLAGLKKQIDMTRIKSPINGNVEESMVKVGQAVSPAMPAFRVVNFNDLKVTADVAEAYANKISNGDEVIVFLPDIQKEITARVTFTSKYVNPVNRTYLVEARLKQYDKNMKANMVAIMKIKDYHVPEALVIPVNLVQTDNKGQFVLVAQQENDGYFARKLSIKTGQIYNGLAEIVTGLEPGQKVITGGYLNLDEGESVRF
ncbi:MAG TPA: efflux RND transporter periplasmic adaptor subunit [Bacteroidales bacterium]|jgi:RND family efflux transporter MFP subunit|nr:efflux RND transporter periplasmic adaptor subunit [Bacteroidales bacterium]